MAGVNGCCGLNRWEPKVAIVGITLGAGLLMAYRYWPEQVAAAKGLTRRSINPLSVAGATNTLDIVEPLPENIVAMLDDIISDVRRDLFVPGPGKLYRVDTPDGTVRLGVIIDREGQFPIGPVGEGSKMIYIHDGPNLAVRAEFEKKLQAMWRTHFRSPDWLIRVDADTAGVSGLIDQIWPPEFQLKPGELFPAALADLCSPDPRGFLTEIETCLASRQPLTKLYRVNTSEGEVRLGVLIRYEGRMQVGPISSRAGVGLLCDGNPAEVRQAFLEALKQLGEKYEVPVRLQLMAGGTCGPIDQVAWS